MRGHTVAESGPRSKQAADQATSNQQDQAVASTNLLGSEQTIQKAVPLPTGLPLGATEQDARASLDVEARAEHELSAPPASHPAKPKQGKWPVPPDQTKVLQEEKDQVQEKVPGPADSNVSPNDIRDITLHAKALSTQGRYAEAASLYRRILAIDEKLFGPEHLNLATSLNNLAVLYETQGRYGEAEPLYQRALALDEKRLGSEHPDVATVLENYAALLRKTHREAEAEGLEARVQEIRTIHTR